MLSVGANNPRLTRFRRGIRNVILVMAGIITFALFIHYSWPLRIIALIALMFSALLMGFSMSETPVLYAFGIDKLNMRIVLFCIMALLIGAGMGIITRNRFNLELWPHKLTQVAIFAPLVGVAEELIFRGYIQGILSPISRVFSLVVASLAHTSYKLVVIISLSQPLEFDLVFLSIWTFLGGLVFGILRLFSNSTLPPIAAHGLFDIILYGGLVTVPFWVWG